MSELPYHLRPDAEPLAQCNRCGRTSWSASEVETEDRMTQPDGNPCGGQLLPLGPPMTTANPKGTP